MTLTGSELSFEEFKKEVQADYKLAWLSRNMSLIARKEVLGGKAKFGIFGDGKEVAQIAMAKQFKPGDWRSGYYRDQTFMLAAGMTTPKIFFAQLYGETRTELNPDNGGRSFNNHFGTRLLNEKGEWKNLAEMKCSASDISPTAGQMPRLVGLALASKLYRNSSVLKEFSNFSTGGDEVAFGTIGDASTSEGHFFETLNSAGTLQIPLAISVWDDGYGISVPSAKQTIKSDISKALKGFEKGNSDSSGILIYRAKGWDYAGLCRMYVEGVAKCRKEHVPVLFHVSELTQPVGHSTSGSHERYKSKERLVWERENDALVHMRRWIIEHKLIDEGTLDVIEKETELEARQAKKDAYKEYIEELKRERGELLDIVEKKGCICTEGKQRPIDSIVKELKTIVSLTRKDILSSARKILRNYCSTCSHPGNIKKTLQSWIRSYFEKGWENYSSHLYCERESSALKVRPVSPKYTERPTLIPGREILRDNFDKMFERNPLVVTFGEDTGKLGGVNQSLEGLQKKYGEFRVMDTGIRETTILGKGIGLALRGLRPIAEIQYFDYLLYALQTLSDDLATLRYRTKNGQKAPVIIRTRGHRLEGIWHSGSPLSMVVNSIRGIYICVPRDMTRAAGFYNTLIEGDDPALVIEPLNGYRIREPRPENIGDYKIPLGVPEILVEGSDVTLVTYGACVSIAQDAVRQLKQIGISVELIDVQTLIPFDTQKVILESLKKTSRIVFFDEDVPGGATAYMMQKVIEEQNGYYHLDATPKTVTAKDHRPAYGTDGDYFSNPNAEDLFETIYDLMGESESEKYPGIYT